MANAIFEENKVWIKKVLELLSISLERLVESHRHVGRLVFLDIGFLSLMLLHNLINSGHLSLDVFPQGDWVYIVTVGLREVFIDELVLVLLNHLYHLSILLQFSYTYHTRICRMALYILHVWQPRRKHDQCCYH